MTNMVGNGPKVKSRSRLKKRLDRVQISVMRDRPVLLFIWKWKVATTQAVYLGFREEFGWAPRTVYERLSILKAKGFVQLAREDVNEGRVWMLTTLGFQVVRPQLPELKEEGFGSENLAHDLLVLAAHLGDWIGRRTQGVSIVTEQQLRRYEKEFLPDWVPKDERHRPDGYWHLPRGDRAITVALEVERTGKGTYPYRKIGDYYNDRRDVDSVIWVVDSRQTLERMVRAFQSVSSTFREIHNFIWLEDFTTYGWQAPIALGPERGHNLFTFLTNEKLVTDPSPTGHGPVTSKVPEILDVAVKRRNFSNSWKSTISKVP